MSIITTWKCDGCGRIARRKEDTKNWLHLSVAGPNTSPEGWPLYVDAHVCTPACLGNLNSVIVEEAGELLAS